MRYKSHPMKSSTLTVILSLLGIASIALAIAPAGDWGDLEDPQDVPVQVPQGYDGMTMLLKVSTLENEYGRQQHDHGGQQE